MANNLRRSYIGSDAQMLEASEQILELFNDDLADFTAFDNELDAAFATAWLAKIDTALGFKSDNTVLGEQREKTDTVEVAMENSRDAIQDIYYFADKAFKTNKAILKEFGIGTRYRKVSYNQAAMVDFLDEFITIVDTHKTALLAKGCPQTTIDNVTTVATALRTENTDQNVTIVLRPETTHERVTELNDAYYPMATVINAAGRVYKDNPEKLGAYRYSPDVSHYPSSIVYIGTLEPNEEKNVVSSGIDQTKTLIITNTSAKTTNVKIRVGLADNPNFVSPNGEVLNAQQRLVAKPEQLPPLPAYFLNIKNLSTTKKASYRVRVRDAAE
jgi:hypothetical protein